MPARPDIIDSRYRVVRSLGEGLSGEVYLVEADEGPVALKLLKPFSDRALEESLLAAFKFEFGLLKDFKHPNVVQIRDFGFDSALGRFYFTEEFLPGKAISDFAAALAPQEIETLFTQTLRGLQALHRAHIRHGDLQANNLLVIAEHQNPLVKIIDLGLSDPRFPFTAGTPSTMPPEKILRDPVDERGDLYSLGVIFYSLLAKENPFVRGSVQQTYEAHLSFQPVPITLKNPTAPVYWNEILEHLLAKNPAHRYRNCGEVLEALELAKPRARSTAIAKTWNPDSWQLRPEISERIAADILTAHREQNPVAWIITGHPGVGKSRLLQEIKYQVQLASVRTFTSRPGMDVAKPTTAPQLWIVDDWSIFSAEEQSEILSSAKSSKSLLLIGCDPASLSELQLALEKLGLATTLENIPPFSTEDLTSFLKRLTGLDSIPEAFTRGLWKHTLGNPRQVTELLQSLAQQKKLVDPHGRWNLAIFNEEAFEAAPLAMDLSAIDHALAETDTSNAEGLAELWLRRAEECLKRGLHDEAANSLGQAEAAAEAISDLGSKFELKARLFERHGYRLIREGRFERARDYLQRALTLLGEVRPSDAVLTIRVNNFLAWLDCQEGKLDRAIESFQRQHELSLQLAAELRAKILNNDLGFAYLLKGDAAKAIASLQDALDFAQGRADGLSLMKIHYNLAEAYVLQKEYAAAMEHYRQASELSRQERNYEFLLRVYNGMGKTFHLQNDLKAALEQYQRALDLARYLEDFSSAAAIAQNIGSIQKDNGLEREAEENFSISLKFLTRLGKKNAQVSYLRCRALLEWGDLERLRGHYEEALAKTHEARQIAFAEEGLQSFRFWVVHTFCKIEKDRGRSDKLQNWLAELLPLADDAEKLAATEEFHMNLPNTSKKDRAVNDATKAESFLPEGFKTLMQVTRQLAGESEPEALLKQITQHAAMLSGAEAAWLIAEDDSGELRVKAAFNLKMDASLREMSTNVAREVLRSGEAVVTGNAAADARFNAYRSVVAQQMHSLLALPVRGPGSTSGVLALTHRYRDDLFDRDRVELLQAFADQAGIALEHARLIAALEKAQAALREDLSETEDRLAEAERRLTEASIIHRFQNSDLIGRHPGMIELFRLLERIKDTPLSVLLRGESGTGKERIARYLHEKSRRAKGSFVAVNCAALPAHLMESELFGYKAGAFTGANRDKKGLIAEASGGTLFLDEIAEMDVTLQSKLLRVLQEKELTRVGDTRPMPVDFRLVTATHQDLKQRILSGKFREDLYYRICEMELQIPPLRERREDIPLLAEAFVASYLEEHGEKAQLKLGRDLLKALLDYDWPGNIRQLENIIRVAVALRRGASLHLADLPAAMQEQLSTKTVSGRSDEEHRPDSGQRRALSLDENSFFDPGKSWEQIELTFIAKALVFHNFDVPKTAAQLNCAPSKVYQRLRENRLEEDSGRWTKGHGLYRDNLSLEEVKKEVFAAALQHCGGSPYETARQLQVSPGMVYKWVTGLRNPDR